MKVSRVRAEASRRTIIEWSAMLVRARGYDGVALKGMMRAAGLTNGAFYGKFDSKDGITVLAAEAALPEGVSGLVRSLECGRDDPLGRVVSDYLSGAHRDGTGDGCVFAASGGAAARHTPETQQTFEGSLVEHLSVVDPAIASSPGSGRLRDSAAVSAAMVGALVLSRVVKGPELSKRSLESAADSIAGGMCIPPNDQSGPHDLSLRRSFLDKFRLTSVTLRSPNGTTNGYGLHQHQALH